MTNHPKIYVACLSAYNNGFLHGKWIDAAQDVNLVWQEIHQMLSNSPMEDAEDWSIHDYEGFPGISIPENPDLAEVVSIARSIVEHGAAMNAFIAWRKNYGYELDFDEIEEQFNEMYCGEWENEEDFALRSDEIAEIYNWKELEEKFEFWSKHIDWEALARDLFLTDYHSVEVNQYDSDSWGIYVFRNY
jgi:antirestriction protein